MPTITDLSIAADVTSAAIAHLEIISNGDGTYDLLIAFNSGDKVYRYAWEDEGECERWFNLLSNDEDRTATSWGRLFHRALKHGDIEQIEV